MQHVTWSINSVCHVWGRRPFRSGDHSTNNFPIAIVSLGEGWHNNHHAFPNQRPPRARAGGSSTRLGRHSGDEGVGLASNVRTPTEKAMQVRSKAGPSTKVD